MMASEWAVAIKKEIHNQVKSQTSHKRFIGKVTLREIWRTVFQQPDHYGIEPESDIYQLRDKLINQDEDESLLIIASILVWTDWDGWQSFSELFTDGHRNSKFRLPLEERTATHILGHRGFNFCDYQPMFLPVTMSEGQNEFTTTDRLPFEESECKPSAGVSGTVKKITVAKGYFRDSNGEINQQPRVFARKKFHYPDGYMQEIEVLKTIRQNLRSHSNILAHMGTLAIGTEDFSILSEFADRGDLHQFLHGDFSGFKSDRKRIIEEAANVADAIDFLHKSFRIGGNDHHCYHLDLKPANVLVFSRRTRPAELRDDVGEWVITDFGFSVLHERIAEGSSRTLPRREPGTYQPPEIDELLGSPSVNAKGDIWSLGGILCMILAFLLDGKRSVDVLTQRRSRTATGSQTQDFYYVVKYHGANPYAELKPQINEWLLEIQKSSDVNDSRSDMSWVVGMIGLIRDCLNVALIRRPDARNVYGRLMQLNGLRVQTGSETPSPPPNVVLPPTISPSTLRPTTWLPGRWRHHRKKSQTVPREPFQRETANPRSPSHDSGLGTSPSTHSAPSSEHSPGAVETLISGASASHVRIDPLGQHIVFCQSEYATVCSLIPGSHRYASYHQVAGNFGSICHAGHYLILYEKLTSKPTFETLVHCADASFSRLSEVQEKFTRALKTALSPSGDVVLMHSRTLRIPKQPPLDFRIPDDIRNEVFQAICYNRSGTRLWACGLKHWFMWDIDLQEANWFLRSRTGALTASRDWKISGPIMFAFNQRSACCFYDMEMRTLRLIDTGQSSASQVSLEPTMLCAVIGCRDDQIFYVRRSKIYPVLALYRRSIQGMRIGSEVRVAELSNLDAKATFDIVCRDEDPAQILVIASTQGKCQSHRFESDEQNHPT